MRALAWIPLAVAAGCAATPPVPPAEELPFARDLLVRESAPAAPLPPPLPVADPAEVPGLPGDPLDGLGGDVPLDGTPLAGPQTRATFVAWALRRDPAVAAARARLDAARRAWSQAAELEALVAIHRSWTRALDVRVGPMGGSRRPAQRIAPWPEVDALRGEVLRETVAMARARLRGAAVATAAEARRVFADAHRVARARTILDEEIALQESLVGVARARFEAGTAPQAGLLAFETRLERLRTRRTDLDDEERLVRTRANRLLARDGDAPLAWAPAGPAAAPAGPPDVARQYERARKHRPAWRIATHAAARADAAARMAARMVVPPPDVGSSRFEREAAGEAGVQRGPVFPEPGRMQPTRETFAIGAAQLAEMRARAAAAERELAAEAHDARVAVRGAANALAAARRDLALHADTVVPLAGAALRSVRGAYEADRSGYLELLEAARELLRGRLGRVDAERAVAHAEAALLAATGIAPERGPEEDE